MSVIHRIALASAATVSAAAAAAFVTVHATGAQAQSPSSLPGHFHTLLTIASTVPGMGTCSTEHAAVLS